MQSKSEEYLVSQLDMDPKPANLLSWGTARALLKKQKQPTQPAVSAGSTFEPLDDRTTENQEPVVQLLPFASTTDMMPGLYLDASGLVDVVQSIEEAITQVEFTEVETSDTGPSQREIEAANDEQVAILNQIAREYASQEKYSECEELYKRIIALRKLALGRDHEKVAMVLNSLGWFYYQQHNLEKAESVLRGAADIAANSNTAGSKLSANIKNNLAEICRLKHNYEEAEKLAHESLQLRQSSIPTDKQEVAQSLTTLGRLYYDEDKLAPAEQYFKRALAIQERALDPTDPDLASTLEAYAFLLRKMGRRNGEAKGMEARARLIRQASKIEARL